MCIVAPHTYIHTWDTYTYIHIHTYIGTGCVDYFTTGVIACVVLFLPLLFIAYVLRKGVLKHARFVPAEGNFFTRFAEVWSENAEKRSKRFLCIPYGLVLVFLDALGAANERGEWEEIDKEEDKDAPPPSFWKNPWSRFLRRFGPMFKDYTVNSWCVAVVDMCMCMHVPACVCMCLRIILRILGAWRCMYVFDVHVYVCIYVCVEQIPQALRPHV